MLIPEDSLKLPKKYAHLTPEQYTEALIDYIQRYKDLISLHVVDFMTKDLWNVIPEEWRLALLPDTNSINQEWIDSIINITSGNGIKEEWPASLKSFIKETEEISLPRHHEAGENQVKSIIDKRILSGMMEKKIHEVERMTPVIQSLADQHQVTSVVDLGAGQGYLSRSIAFQSHFKVLAIDSSEIQTCGAKKFDEKAVKKMDRDALKLHHVTDFITQENASTILSKWSDHPQEEKWLLCGLHTCGDLASHMLRLFTSSQDMTCFVDVGCCYHFLTEGGGGFPVSRYVDKKQFKLGPRATMLSCQAPSRWIDQPEETLMAYEHHFFRCLLQYIMVEKGMTDISKAPVLGRLNKKRDFTSFPVYVKAALKRLKLPEDSITSEEAATYYTTYKYVDKQIMILWTLRVLLGPVIESLILMDRWLYLDETIPNSPTKRVWLWPLFDPIISPRNMVLAATK